MDHTTIICSSISLAFMASVFFDDVGMALSARRRHCHGAFAFCVRFVDC